MAYHTTSSHRIAKQWAELSLAAPQVIMHRTFRMAAAGHDPSARDRAEFTQMSSEKVIAFYQSWIGMWTATFTVQYELARVISNALLAVATGGQASAATTAAAASNAVTKVISAGLDPVHKKAVANAKRLSNRKY